LRVYIDAGSPKCIRYKTRTARRDNTEAPLIAGKAKLQVRNQSCKLLVNGAVKKAKVITVAEVNDVWRLRHASQRILPFKKNAKTPRNIPCSEWIPAANALFRTDNQTLVPLIQFHQKP
jgi:hypothetical protein